VTPPTDDSDVINASARTSIVSVSVSVSVTCAAFDFDSVNEFTTGVLIGGGAYWAGRAAAHFLLQRAAMLALQAL